MNAVDMINKHYDELTKSERKVADYIVSNKDKVIHNTISDLKQLLNVGDATINRLCKKVGFSGFTDLKISIAKNNVKLEHDSFNNTDLLNKIKETLDRTHELIDKNDYREVVRLIERETPYLYFRQRSKRLSGNGFGEITSKKWCTINSPVRFGFSNQCGNGNDVR